MTGTLVAQLEALGVKQKVLVEIAKSGTTGEKINGSVDLHLKCGVVFTNRRIISVSTIPLVGINTEWLNGKIVMMGGNFQIPYTMLSEIRRAKSRVRVPHATHTTALTKIIKAVGPSISTGLWPYEFQLVDKSEKAINRIYGVNEDQAASIRDLSKRSGLRFVIE